jgi:hypothetical protein
MSYLDEGDLVGAEALNSAQDTVYAITGIAEDLVDTSLMQSFTDEIADSFGHHCIPYCGPCCVHVLHARKW